MNLHTHGHHDCALTGEITSGDFDGGYLFTRGYLGGGEVKARAWAHWGGQIIWERLVDARASVLFGGYHLHGPTRCVGDLCASVCYTSAS